MLSLLMKSFYAGYVVLCRFLVIRTTIPLSVNEAEFEIFYGQPIFHMEMNQT